MYTIYTFQKGKDPNSIIAIEVFLEIPLLIYSQPERTVMIFKGAEVIRVTQLFQLMYKFVLTSSLKRDFPLS